MENANHKYLIELIRCAMLGKKLPDGAENVNIGTVCSIAHAHHVENIIHPLLSGINGYAQSPVGAKMNQRFMFAAAKEATQTYEADRVLTAFEDNGIDCIPLKGYILKHLYPSPEMRQSTDFDVYVPFTFNSRTCEVMDSLGFSYDKEAIGMGMHDNYHLGKIMEVEVHKSLMAPDFPKWCRLCEELVKNAVLSDGYKHRYEFSNEDYYLYMQLHTIKHLKHSGCGIKSILDIWVYLNRYENELDWKYITRMLEKGGLVEVDKNLRALSDYWFNKKEPENEIVYALGEYIIDSGAFGTYEQYMSGQHTDVTKSKRFLRAFFMPLEEMKIKYPILKRLPFLLPFFWIYRAASSVLSGKKTAKAIMTDNPDVSDEYARNLSEFKQKIGL